MTLRQRNWNLNKRTRGKMSKTRIYKRIVRDVKRKNKKKKPIKRDESMTYDTEKIA